MSLTASGISYVGEISWGTHFCQFYNNRDDLVSSLVPYFKAGIDNNEKCLWVTADPFRADDARAALKNAVPDLTEREKKGQIEILNHEQWYTGNGVMDTPSVLKACASAEQGALDKGFNGLRITGNTNQAKIFERFTQLEVGQNSALIRKSFGT